MQTPAIVLYTALFTAFSSAILVYYAPLIEPYINHHVFLPQHVNNSSKSHSRAQYDFVMITDLDLESRDKANLSWKSYLFRGTVKRDPVSLKYKFTTNSNATLQFRSQFARSNRSMELSCLTMWNNRLYTACDYTGVVYELDLVTARASQKFMLTAGDGNTHIPLKAEWCTVDSKNRLVVGSIGKEWTLPDGSIDPERSMQWVKRISSVTFGLASLIHTILMQIREYATSSTIQQSSIVHENWERLYQLIREKTNATYPGYIIHESVLYDRDLKQWIFLPRKVSTDIPYSEAADETMGSNLLIFVDEPLNQATLDNIHVKTVGVKDPLAGFTDIAKIPGTMHYIATKAIEVSGMSSQTFVTVFDRNGTILSDPEFYPVPDNYKFEGIEILH